ncbi:MAG TPA: phosphoribosyltransferase family protein [Paraburkholderia sp.]|nr:phosphoribosyltransferase family protein [Paraburkholderia sp.]
MDTEFSRFPIYFYGYNEIETFCLAQREQLLQEDIGLILGILRGGGIPALMLSQMLGIPVDFVHYNRREARAEIKNQEVFDLINSCTRESKKILLVEDIAGVGYTLINCHDYLQSLIKDRSLIKVLALLHHENSRTKADYSKDCSAVRAILPWERYVTSNQCLDEFVKTGEALIDDQRFKKTLAVNDPTIPLTLKNEWRIDYHFEFDGDHHSAINFIQSIGPEEIYCNSESLISIILSKLPFVIVYKVIEQKRYRISSLD